MISVSKLDEFW